MNLYLMRHGIAVAADDPNTTQDNDRPLTQKGIKRMRRAARGVARLKLPFDGILTSPVLRARQTAEIIANRLGMEAAVEAVSGLAPESTVEQLLFSVTRFRERQHLLLVGHEPLLSKTMSCLLLGSAGQSIEIEMRKGSLCRIEIDGLAATGQGILHWHLAPKQLRLLG